MAMKLGAEDKKKVAVVVILGVIVIALVLRALFAVMGTGKQPTLPPEVAQTPASQTQPESQTNTGHQAVKISSSLQRLDPTLHPEWMAAAESLKYEGNGRNIFSMSSVPADIDTPKGPIRPNALEAKLPPGPPPPPPIDLKFYGFESHSGGAPKAFLLHGDDIFIASSGDVVDHRYKIVSIAPMSIQVQDIPYNDTQTLPLIQN